MLLALAIPFIAVTRLRGYSCDIEIFDAWATCVWSGGVVNGVCQKFHINYPSIGILSSAGVMWALSSAGFVGEFRARALPFREVLAVVDAANLILFFALLRALRIRFAAWWTLAFSLLPSTRAGSAMFGQIDGVSQFFLSLGFLCLNRAWSAFDSAGLKQRGNTWLLLLAATILTALSVKQLVVFTVPVLAVGFGYLLYRSVRRFGPPWGLAAAILMLLGILSALDRIFPVPTGYFGSVMLYSLGEGSGHGKAISNNGFNIFTLLPTHQSSSSTNWYPFLTIGGFRVLGIPLYNGIVLFLCFNAIALWCLSRLAAPFKSLDATRGTLLCLALASSLNISMVVFLTGTHERYLYHYGFFIIPCVLWLFDQGRIRGVTVALITGHLIVYGLFVYSKIGHLSPTLRLFSSQRLILFATLGMCLGGLIRLVAAARDDGRARTVSDKLET